MFLRKIKKISYYRKNIRIKKFFPIKFYHNLINSTKRQFFKKRRFNFRKRSKNLRIKMRIFIKYSSKAFRKPNNYYLQKQFKRKKFTRTYSSRFIRRFLKNTTNKLQQRFIQKNFHHFLNYLFDSRKISRYHPRRFYKFFKLNIILKPFSNLVRSTLQLAKILFPYWFKPIRKKNFSYKLLLNQSAVNNLKYKFKYIYAPKQLLFNRSRILQIIIKKSPQYKFYQIRRHFRQSYTLSNSTFRMRLGSRIRQKFIRNKLKSLFFKRYNKLRQFVRRKKRWKMRKLKYSKSLFIIVLRKYKYIKLKRRARQRLPLKLSLRNIKYFRLIKNKLKHLRTGHRLAIGVRHAYQHLFYLHLRQTYNNFFIMVCDVHGKTFQTKSAGATEFKGSRRATTQAVEIISKRLILSLITKGVFFAPVILRSPPSKLIRAAVRAFRRAKFNIPAVLVRIPTPHNGLRKSASRRVLKVIFPDVV